MFKAAGVGYYAAREITISKKYQLLLVIHCLQTKYEGLCIVSGSQYLINNKCYKQIKGFAYIFM